MFGNSRYPAALVLLLAVAAVAGGCRVSDTDPVAVAQAGLLDGWRPDAASGVPERVADGWRFECPFPEGADRHVWDAPVSAPPAADGILVTYTLEMPAAFRGVTWYVRSGAGWYAAPLPVGEGRQRAWLPFAAFEASGNPAGWEKADAVRLSPWTAGRGPGAVILHDVQVLRADTGVVMPGSLSSPDPREQAFGRRNAERWLDDLTRIGVSAIPVEEAELAMIKPDRLKVWVLPYNPRPAPEMVKALQSITRAGGALVVSYSGATEVAALVGVTVDRWLPAGRPGRWHRMTFNRDGWNGPDYLYQASTPNLMAVKPGALDAKVRAWWEDAAGVQQPEPALIVTPRGAWFSYLVGADDDANRLRLLAFLLEDFRPGTARAAVRLRLDQAARRGGAEPGPGLAAAFEEAEALLASGEPAAAWEQVDTLNRMIDLEEASQVALPDGLRMGIWDHAGRGLYAGDWPGTMAELAAAGFTDLFVYCSRSAPLPTAAIEAAAPHGIRIHAWHICYNLDGADSGRVEGFARQNRLQQSLTGASTPWLCPTMPENRRAERERMVRLAGTPGLAGVHLDYIRYPDQQHCFCNACRLSFEQAEGRLVEGWPDQVVEGPLREPYVTWRAMQITQLVREVSEAVRAAHPGVQISAAVWPNLDMVRNVLGQDWAAWMEENLLDFVTPMSYTESAGELEAWTTRHNALPGAGGRVWAGLGVTSSHSRLDAGQTLRQIRAAGDAGAVGVVVFDLNATVRAELFPVLRALAEGERDD